MTVGGLRTYKLMTEIIADGDADFISICRPLIKEPSLINTLKKDTRYKPTCVSCNKCYEALLNGQPLHCAAEKPGDNPDEA